MEGCCKNVLCNGATLRAFMRVHYKSLKTVLALFLMATLVSCKPSSCPVGAFLKSDDSLSYNLNVSVSLQDVQELIKPGIIYGKYFCLSDATVIYDAKAGSTSQPCFQLMPKQVFQGEARLAQDSTLYEVMNPDQFFRYYQSIPKELNKFLAIRVQSHSSILTGIVKGLGNTGYVDQSFLSPDDLWRLPYPDSRYPSEKPPEDATTFSFYGVLHSFLLTEQDSFIYIYLPLNLGIQTLAYGGVLPGKAGYQTQANNYANPAFKLTPSFSQNVDFTSYRELTESCEAYNGLFFHIKLTPGLLRPALVAYQTLVQNYLQKHPSAFLDPYAQP